MKNSSVVITGIGVVSPVGIGREPFWSSMRDGKSGIAPLPWLENTEMPVRFGAAVHDFEPKQYVKPRKALKVMSRDIQLGFSAATLAVADAALEDVDPDRYGVVYGSEMGYCPPDDLSDAYRPCIENGSFDFGKWGESAMSNLFPLWMLKYLPNMVACHVGIAQDARGPNNSITLGEASGLIALIEACLVIERGMADVMIVGGAGSRINLTPWMFRGNLGLSRRNDDPAAASRPFDMNRDGMVNGEAGAALVLERPEYAAARGANVMARVAGFHHTFGRRNVEPEVFQTAIERSIRGALDSASSTPQDISHVKAHGAATVADDPIEARAIRACLGDVPVTAPKSQFGNLGAAGSVVELASVVLSIQHGFVPRTINYDTPDPACPIRIVCDPIEAAQNQVLALNQSGTGQAAAAVLASP